MPQPTARDRRKWLKWHDEHGRNVAASARHFGISRSTLYRWLKRALDAPGKPLRAKSRRPHHQRQPVCWTPFDLLIVADINMEHPLWGRGRVHAVLAEHGFPCSEAVVGRLLRQIRQRCSVCRATQGQHHGELHALTRDFLKMGLVPPWVRRLQADQRPRSPDAPAIFRQVRRLLQETPPDGGV